MKNQKRILLENAKKSNNEHCWSIFGIKCLWFWFGRMSYLGEGEPSNVTFSDDYIDHVIKYKDLFIGFHHTHPNWVAVPSLTDVKTMSGWTFTLGEDILCGITGTDGQHAYWFREDKGYVRRKIWVIGNWCFGFCP